MAPGCIFVVDDDASLRRALQRLVRSLDIDCELSPSGEDMLVRLPALRPTLVLLDIHMPEKSGLETLADMRARGFDVPTVMMTGVETVDTRAACLSGGAGDMICKPIDAKTISRIFDRLAGRQGADPGHT
ncbi:MAG: response regulator [Rhodobacterales bacterium]|nr:response regulator [Rhodobacterales bacterium]